MRGGLMKILTVVIPCYNSEAYMCKAIDHALIGGPDVHPALAARLDRYNESNKKRLKNDFAGYPDAITKEYNKRYYK